MILVDTSIWVQHFREGEPDLVQLLDRGQVLGHPFVAGELALGNLPDRTTVLHWLGQLPPAVVARNDEVLRFIVSERLSGEGIGYVDASLLAATRLTPEARFWTRDRRLNGLALRMGLAFPI